MLKVDIKVVDVNFDLETVDDTNLSTTTDADSTDTTTLNVTSTTGVEVGDFVVITSDHAPVQLEHTLQQYLLVHR